MRPQVPCGNCTKRRLQCVPATQARPRRRRFPERELLDRLRKCEDLLRQNKVEFEPLHKDPSVPNRKSPEASNDDQLGAEGPPPSTTPRSDSTYEPKNIWPTISPGLPKDPSHGLRETISTTWDQSFDSGAHILFGSHRAPVDLATLHPEPVHIFRLWQIYLDNVNPLLKVTHTPSLQRRIVEAVSNVKNISPPLESLMFGIYCMATLSLSPVACQDIFHQSKEQLLTKYQFGCQQALLDNRFLRTNDRDCLTAFHLYLHSSRSGAHVRSISSLTGVAIRIAERIGLQTESINARYTVLEAEMRRRLWWSLVLFDARISALSNHKATTLTPSWDCAVPLNVSDSDLREEMKQPPVVKGEVSEALFAVLGGELGEFVRHKPFFLDFTNPVLKPIAKELPGGGDLAVLQEAVEDKYLKFCDSENPLHFMILWMTRTSLSNYRLMEDYSNLGGQRSEEQRDATLSKAFNWLECDTKLAASPLTKRFTWFLHLYFPFPAYIRIAQELKARPTGCKAQYAWEVMSDNCEARFGIAQSIYNPAIVPFAGVILKTWDALEAAVKDSKQPVTPPRIVSNLKLRMAELAAKQRNLETRQLNAAVDTGADDLSLSVPMDIDDHNLMYGQDCYTGPGSSKC